jgi:hypothetical protein
VFAFDVAFGPLSVPPVTQPDIESASDAIAATNAAKIVPFSL